MKKTTVGMTLIAAALLSGCIVVPARPYGRYYGEAHVNVVETPRYGGGYDRGGRDYGPPPAPRRGW